MQPVLEVSVLTPKAENTTRAVIQYKTKLHDISLSDDERYEQEQRNVNHQVMLAAAQEARKAEFAAYGSMKAGVQTVSRNKIWVDPNYPITFTEEELQRARKSLIASKDKQAKPFLCLEVPNPNNLDPQGTSQNQLLIIDPDGVLLFIATAGGSDRDFDIIVEPYRDHYYQYMLRQVTGKSQQHVMRRVDIGRTYLYAKAIYNIAKAEADKLKEGYPSFKQQNYIAAEMGISESELSYCITMAEQPQEILDFVEKGKITEGQLREIIAVKDVDQRLILAHNVAEANQELMNNGGKPLTIKRIRDKKQAIQKQVELFSLEHIQRQVSVQDLWFNRFSTNENVSATVMIAAILHDLSVILPDVKVSNPSRVLRDLLKIIHNPEVQSFIEGLNIQDESEEDLDEEIS